MAERVWVGAQIPAVALGSVQRGCSSAVVPAEGALSGGGLRNEQGEATRCKARIKRGLISDEQRSLFCCHFRLFRFLAFYGPENFYL